MESRFKLKAEKGKIKSVVESAKNAERLIRQKPKSVPPKAQNTKFFMFSSKRLKYILTYWFIQKAYAEKANGIRDFPLSFQKLRFPLAFSTYVRFWCKSTFTMGNCKQIKSSNLKYNISYALIFSFCLT